MQPGQAAENNEIARCMGRTIAMSSKCPTVGPELAEGRVIRSPSWFDRLTTNGFVDN